MLKPINDTAKTASVALTAFKHFFYNFYLIFQTTCRTIVSTSQQRWRNAKFLPSDFCAHVQRLASRWWCRSRCQNWDPRVWRSWIQAPKSTVPTTVPSYSQSNCSQISAASPDIRLSFNKTALRPTLTEILHGISMENQCNLYGVPCDSMEIPR